MIVNGIHGVKSYITKKYPNFVLYKYFLKNGNVLRECYSTWIQTDFSNNIKMTPEEHIEKHLDTLADRR